MSTKIQAIETKYAGYNFRSRTEARWAIWLDAIGVKWEYEVEGYTLPSGWYLPDFWIDAAGCWLEIKGDKPTPDDLSLCDELAASGDSVLLLWGTPKQFTLIWWTATASEMGPGNVSVLSYRLTRRLVDAHQAAERAMSARFEHGETPQVKSAIAALSSDDEPDEFAGMTQTEQVAKLCDMLDQKRRALGIGRS